MENIPYKKERDRTFLNLWLPSLLYLELDDVEFGSLRDLGFCTSSPMQQGDWKVCEDVVSSYIKQENTKSDSVVTLSNVDVSIFSMKGIIIKTANKPDCDEKSLCDAIDESIKMFLQAMSTDIALHDLLLRLHDDLEIQVHIIEPTINWARLNLAINSTRQIICFVITHKVGSKSQ